MYTLVCISFERHRAIIHVDNQGRTLSFQKQKMLICLIWMLAFAVSVPTLLEYTVHRIHTVTVRNKTVTQLSCWSQISHELAIANAVFVFTISYAIPVILMFRNYLQVAVYLWRQGRRIGENLGSTVHNVTSFGFFKQRIRLVKLLILVAVIFATSWLPFFVMLLYAVSMRHQPTASLI